MYEIVEHVCTETGRVMYEVVENDSFMFTSLGWFKHKAMAENHIERICTYEPECKQRY